MKEELTREEVRKYAVFAADKDLKRFATALLKEMDKPKHDVWKNAPEWATLAEVLFIGNGKSNWRHKCQYTREIPKTRARQIAEEVISENVGGVEDKVSLLTDLIETALEKYAAELKGKE